MSFIGLFLSVTSRTAAPAVTIDDSITTLINYGAIGACLVALALYYTLKDRKYEARIDEIREMEKAFRREQAEQQEQFRREQADTIEKYRQSMQQVASTLDVLTEVIKKGG